MRRAIVISSKLHNIDNVREFIREIFKEANLNMRFFNRIFIGISEAVNNAILHGNKLNPEKNVFIKMRLKGNRFFISIKDEGNGFNKTNLADPTMKENINREHGRGIFLISKIADKLTFKEDGRKILIQFTIPE